MQYIDGRMAKRNEKMKEREKEGKYKRTEERWKGWRQGMDD